jgi:hypothetical protein
MKLLEREPRKPNGEHLFFEKTGIIFYETAPQYTLSFDEEKEKHEDMLQIFQSRFTLVKKNSLFKKNVEGTINPYFNTSNELSGYVFVLRDISEKLESEEMKSQFASIVEYSDDAIMSLNMDGTILSWNKGAEKLFKYKESEVKGKNIYILTPPFYPNEMPQILEAISEEKIIEHYETVRQTKKGEIIDVSLTVSPIKDKDKKITACSVIARDITDRRLLEKQVIEIGNREKTRIGQDLHDSIGQQLTGISLSVKALEKALVSEGLTGQLENLSGISKMVKDAIIQVKELANGLVPITLKEEGLVFSLMTLAEYTNRIYGIETVTDFDESLVVEDLDISTHLYRLAQEAINNAVKYAKPDKITMTLKKDEKELELHIIDDGIGYENKNKKGLGLKIMQYRTNLMKGHFSIFKRQEGGTAVRVRVPFKGSTV